MTPHSETWRKPVISPAPFSTGAPAGSGAASTVSGARGTIAVAPVRATPRPSGGGASSRTTVTWPTRTSPASVIAFTGPVAISPIRRPSSRSPGRRCVPRASTAIDPRTSIAGRLAVERRPGGERGAKEAAAQSDAKRGTARRATRPQRPGVERRDPRDRPPRHGARSIRSPAAAQIGSPPMRLSLPIVWSDRHRLHEPGREVWVGIRTPGNEVPRRAEAIRDAPAACDARFADAEPHPDADVLAVHDAALLDYSAARGTTGPRPAAGRPRPGPG